jgi:imidazolonepropionase-like amidohydrolase
MAMALRCGQLIDGSGATPKGNAIIVVDGDRIAAVGGLELINRGMQVLDLLGHWVLPGLIDLHTHICFDGSIDPFTAMRATPQLASMRATHTLPRYLRAGITTIREAGAWHGVSFAAKEAMAQGLIQGPRIIAAGQWICMTGGHGWQAGYEVDGPHEARKAVREQLKQGADVIKLMATGGVITPGQEMGAPQLTLDEMTAAVEEARKAGKRVMAHAMGPVGIKTALEAGVDTIEHGVWFGPETVELMLKHDAWLVPTLSIMWMQAKHGKEAGMAAHIVHKATLAQETMFDAVALARKCGVKIAMGSDSGGPLLTQDMIALELDLMLKSGACLNTLEAIQAATSRAAEALGRSTDLGSIRPGALADILALKANPLEDVAALRQVAMVMKDGKVVYRAE